MLDMLDIIMRMQDILLSPCTLEEAKLEARFFTRNRKMSFSEILMFILDGIHSSTQSALNRFFGKYLEARNTPSQQALSKARSHFNHSPFEKMFRACVEMRYYGEHEITKLYDYQLLAVDGSDIALPDLPTLLEEFGGTGRNADAPTAKISILYDVLNDFILDAAMDKASASERILAVGHMEKLKSIAPEVDKLLIFDRGYPSEQLIEELSGCKFHFLMRVRSKWNLDVDAVRKDGEVELKSGRRIRVVKFNLPSGEEETLLTDLFELPEDVFRELYFKRWPIETKYDIVKNKLALENFSGYSKNVILQDFWACMQVTNMASVAKDEADASISEKRRGKENKYVYVSNLNQVIASLKDHVLGLFFATTNEERERILSILKNEIQRTVVPVRPYRTVKRPLNPRKAKFHHNRKFSAGS